jgi:S1/P1 Nuclease
MMKTLILIAVLISTNAFAWGPTGHRTIGAVAEKYLETSVAVKVYQILRGQSLSRVSTWPDEIKSEPKTYSYTYNWHYTDWKDENHQHDETNSSGKLLTSIREQMDILKNSEASQEKKAFALKFIVHLVGDLHMPLHVGNGIDRGGNTCNVLFHKKETNLHALWDEGMIDYTNLSFSELAIYVSQGRTREEITDWKSGDVLDWALESKNLRGMIYPGDVVPPKTQMSVRSYCRTDGQVAREEMPNLGYEYSYKFVPVVEKRLFQAGIRLAMMLNLALK